MGKGVRVARGPARTVVSARTRPSNKIDPGTRVVVEALIVELAGDGRARARTGDGRIIDCRCAQGIDVAWLRAALVVGPVDAEITIGARGGSLWAVFAGPEHAAVKPEHVSIAASASIDLRCGSSTVSLKRDGRVRVRGRDVITRGSRVARVQGHTVRLN